MKSLLGLAFVGSLFWPLQSHAFTFDAYRGINQISCPSGAANHFYLQKKGSRWLVCTPAGHGFWPMGVVLILSSGSTANMQTKYGADLTNVTAGYIVSGLTAAQRYEMNYDIHAIQQLQTWNFNFVSDGSYAGLQPVTVNANWNTADQTIPSVFRMPFNGNANSTRYAMGPTGGASCSTSFPLKDQIQSVGYTYDGTVYNYGDYFDPHWPTCANILIDAYMAPFIGAPHNDYLLWFTIDEGDQMGGMLGLGYYSGFNPVNINNGTPNGGSLPGGHAGWVTLSADPIQPFRAVIKPEIYTDEEVYSKVELANELANEYVCTGSGTSKHGALACCTGSGTGACSVDPASASYIGSTNATASDTIGSSAGGLDAAWSAFYTTFGTSDSTDCGSSLASCLQNGTYAAWGDHTSTFTCSGTTCAGTLTPHPVVEIYNQSYFLPAWMTSDGLIYGFTYLSSPGTILNGGFGSLISSGSVTDATGAFTMTLSSSIASHTVYATWRTQANSTGTGILDEDGTCPSRGANPCWMGDSITQVGETTAMKADLDHFLYEYTSLYLSTLCGRVHSNMPGVICEMDVGGYGVPPRKPALQAIGQYLDLPGMDEIPPYCPTCTDLQARVDAIAAGMGDRPFKNWEGWFSNPDSALSGINQDGNNISSTQGGRGSAFAGMSNLLINTKNTQYGTFPSVGFYWWQWYDGGDGFDWGLHSPSDNVYDGHEAVIASVSCSSPGTQYSCGGEAANYGDFVDSVSTANLAALNALISSVGSGGSYGTNGVMW